MSGSLYRYPIRCTTPEVVLHTARWQFAGTGAPTKNIGDTFTVVRTGTGIYEIVWTENHGHLIGALFTLGADTPGGVAGWVVVFDTDSWTATSKKLEFRSYNAAGTITDLPPNSHLMIAVLFRETAIGAV